MIQISIKDIYTQLPGLTQQNVVTRTGDVLNTAVLANPAGWSRTYSSSWTSEIIRVIGKGVVDVPSYCDVFYSFARMNNIEVSAVVDDYMDYHNARARDLSFWLKLVNYLTGNTTRTIRPKTEIGKIPPTLITEFLKKEAPHERSIYPVLLSDFICQAFAQLGYIHPDAGYAYRISKLPQFPRYQDLVDVIKLSQFRKVLTALSTVDVELIKKAFAEGKGVTPGLFAQTLANSAVSASDRIKGSYDADSVVSSVLNVLGRIWSPGTPDSVSPSLRIRNVSRLNELTANLALFLAYQEMMRNHVPNQIIYSDEELSSVIIPLFIESMNTESPFVVRTISDAVGYLGVVGTWDIASQPRTLYIYEKGEYPHNVLVFNSVRPGPNTGGKNFHYLDPDPTLASRMSATFETVGSLFNVENIVKSQVVIDETTDDTQVNLTTKTTLSLVLPSISARSDSYGRPIPNLKEELAASVVLEKEEAGHDRGDATVRDIESARHDYYSLLVHLACSRNPTVSIAEHVNRSEALFYAPTLYLRWDIQTQLSIPVGRAQISQGSVSSTEPIETIAYWGPVNPTSKLTSAAIPLDSFKEDIHIWPWYSISKKLEFNSQYDATISNRNYSPIVQETEMLGLGYKRERTRFIIPNLAVAVVKSWVDFITQSYDDLGAKQETVQDSAMKIAYQGRQQQLAIMALQVVERLATTTIGHATCTIAQNKIVDRMAGLSILDDVPSLCVAAQQHRVRVWAGITTLQFLRLLTDDQAMRLQKIISDSSVITALVAGGVFAK